MQVAFLGVETQRGPAPYTKRNAMQRSKFDIGRADAGAGGMSCQSAPGQVARLAWARRLRRLTPLPWSSPRVFWSGLRLDLLGEEIVVGMGVSRPFRKWASLWARTPTGAQRLILGSMVARDAHSAEDCRRHALIITMSSNEPSMTERARVALACAWMQLLKLRKTATSQGCKYDVLRGGRNASTM